VPFNILETVLGDTPALVATMLKVAFAGLPVMGELLRGMVGLNTQICLFYEIVFNLNVLLISI
jgi:hypothetical protein